MKLLLLFLLLELSLFASIGKISALNGNVVVDRNKQQLNASVGFDLEEKDLISTDEKSKAQITLNDGTVLSLGKNSKLNINEYVFDENNSDNSKAEFKFVEGTFKSITGAIGKVAPEKFKLETKSASIGIRGTIVVGNQEKVACTQGQITVTSAGVTQVLGAGMMTNTEIGKAPTTPTKIEGNLLKEVDNVGSKEESKSTTSETKEKATTEEKTSENTKAESLNEKEQSSTPSEKTTTTLTTSSIEQNISNVSSNISTFTEVTNTVNATITQTTTNKIQEDITDVKKKTETIDAAIILLNEANTIVQSVALASTNTSSASISATTIAKDATISSETQTAINTASNASTSAINLSTQAQTLKTEIEILLTQAQSASVSDVVAIYEQIKTKYSSLNTISLQAIDTLTIAQNSLKTVSVNLSSSLSTQANTIAQSVALASTNTSSASISATTIAKDATISSETQTAINTASNASTSAINLSTQAQTLKTEIEILLTQAQSASVSDVVAIYEQIKTKYSSLNTISLQAIDTLIIAQNSLKTVSVNLSSSLSTQANTIAQSIASTASNTQISVNTATLMVENASSSAMIEAKSAANLVNNSVETITSLSTQAQVLKTEIATLLTQAQNASASDVVAIYEQIQTKANSLNIISLQVAAASTIALNSSNAVVNIPVYSAIVNISSRGIGSVGSKTFTVGSGGSNVTIATYASSNNVTNSDNSNKLDPVLILLKLNSSGNYETISNNRNDDSWIVADSFNNAILNLNLTSGTYKILVADFSFNTEEALSGVNNGTNDEGAINLYFTSTSNLTFDSSDSTIEKYSYITRYNNKAYINDLNYQIAQIENNNAKFGILADSKVGTAIKIDNYGYFVTISDSFDNSKNVFLNSSEVDDESSWGYWAKTLPTNDTASNSAIDMKSTWISGNQVTAPEKYSATLQGQVIGGVTIGNNTGYIKLDSNNILKATIDIGTATISNSLIQFKDSLSNNLWSGTFDISGSTNVNSQGFSSSIVSNSNNISGSLSGKYFGTTNANVSTVKSIGGEFNMTNGGATANGVFKAREIPIVVPPLQSNIGQ